MNAADRSDIVKRTMEKLRQVSQQKTDHDTFVKNEIEQRDFLSSKKEISAEIKLQEFSGREEEQDYYSFKSTFEKKYKDVRKPGLVEILKSSLSGEAKVTAKELTSLEEIWERLKSNFGDPNIMLRNKMSLIYKAAGFGKGKSAKDVKDTMVSLVNSITDVMKLVKDHKIEVKLYGKHEVNDVVGRFPPYFQKAWYV